MTDKKIQGFTNPTTFGHYTGTRPCVCDHCGTRWTEEFVHSGAVMNGYHRYDYCSECQGAPEKAYEPNKLNYVASLKKALQK